MGVHYLSCLQMEKRAHPFAEGSARIGGSLELFGLTQRGATTHRRRAPEEGAHDVSNNHARPMVKTDIKPFIHERQLIHSLKGPSARRLSMLMRVSVISRCNGQRSATRSRVERWSSVSAPRRVSSTLRV